MLSEIIAYLWICVSIAAAVVEISMLSRIAIWFVPSAIFAFFLSLFEAPVWVQVACFIIISLILTILSRVALKKAAKIKKTREYKMLSLIGKTAIVTEEIDNERNTGSVRVDGSIWTARTEYEDIIYENGIVVTIVEADGDCLICER